MSTSSSSSSVMREKPKIFKVSTDGQVYCNHDMVALCRVAGHKSSRPGQPWFGCPLWPSMDCKFFMWKEDVDVVFAKEGNWKVLELKNKALEMKIENLEVEKMILVEENKKLRMKIAMSNCAGMKVYNQWNRRGVVEPIVELGLIYGVKLIK
ncbi:hypothetical protein QVD17_33814 [Tagetes erecta]|uniref:Zinc finger GRF-type domain-containing protein n=1 Tax=Tagetes erecta TaxID=13708 RepID=A0AAD8JZW5_TARER|nr:hypothetical protein QVD17_33814 [Tagetes erecta]